MYHAFEAGFALAALVAGDPELSTVRDALAPGLLSRVERYASAVRGVLSSDRGAAVRRVTTDARHLPVDGGVEPRRVLAVIATEVDKSKGAAWIAAVPRHRPGWSVPAELKAALLRHAGPSAAQRAVAEIGELEAAWPA